MSVEQHWPQDEDLCSQNVWVFTNSLPCYRMYVEDTMLIPSTVLKPLEIEGLFAIIT